MPPQPPVADTYASGISSTHSPPDYPPLARRLGEQGSVRLGLTISATGEVTGATVVQSSGFADLDQMATDWVIGHWKYKPATHDGVAVPTQTQAVVVFNLKNAR
ncbi:MAG: energy transducer TonB [Rhizomicrobium sp.]